MQTGPLQVDRDRDVVTLTLDRPHVRNAIDAELMRGITETMTQLADDEQLRAIVLTGADDVFSSGADLGWMGAVADSSYAENLEDSRTFERMLRSVHDAPVAVLARVNGHAIAGASGLVACTDIAVAVRGARFGFTEVRLGLVPAMVSCYVVPRIGEANARRYLLTGELFDADRARELGLVHEVCEPEELDTVFGEVLDHVVSAGPEAQRETKRLLPLVSATPSPEATEDLRVEAISRARMSDEAQERIRAFLELRGGGS